MKVRLSASTTIVAVLTALLMVFVLPAGIAAGSGPSLSPGPSYTVWAYGAVRTVDFSGSSTQGYSYHGNATYGYTVILNQTNTSSQTFELSVNRTMSAALSVEYCYLNCRNPALSGTVSHRAWESDDAWANFTTNGTVSENGQNAFAIALLNSHSMIAGNLTDVAKGPMRTSYLSATVASSTNVNFAIPLGLLPNNLAAPIAWSSTRAFTASGSYAVGYLYASSGPRLSTQVGPVTFHGSVSHAGNLTVSGSTTNSPSGTVDFGGVPYLNVSLNVQGPFDAREGFILVPEEVDLFGSGNANAWSGNETGGTSVQMTSLYVQRQAGDHLGIDGSEWFYAASALNPSATDLAPNGMGATQIASGSDDVGSTPVQGVPIEVSQARGYDGCLVSGAGCPTSTPRSLLGVISLGVLVAVVAVAIASVLVVERRRIPPPSYPNAKLYPPGSDANPPTAPGAPAATVRRPPPPEAGDDPLANLW
jgi:hypothetical protein